MIAPKWPLETERLTLRQFAGDDLVALHEMHSDEAVVRWLYNDVRSLEETRELLDRKIAGGGLAREGEWMRAAAVLRETGELVGDLSLLWASEVHKQGELGFMVHPRHQGADTRRRRLARFCVSHSRSSACNASSGLSRPGTAPPRGCSRSSACVARVTSSKTSG